VPAPAWQDLNGSAGTLRQRQSNARGHLASDTTAFPPDSPARNFSSLFPATSFPAAFPAEEPASRRAATINRGVVGGGETPKTIADHHAIWARLRDLVRQCYPDDDLAAETTARALFDGEEAASYAADLDA
jgi:hypothetical protein